MKLNNIILETEVVVLTGKESPTISIATRSGDYEVSVPEEIPLAFLLNEGFKENQFSIDDLDEMAEQFDKLAELVRYRRKEAWKKR